MKSAEIRKKFLSYFEERGHTVVPSSSLIPAGDPTLMFVNAGMVPFKDLFLGKEQRSYTRAASCQRCLRVSGKHNDLEEVGYSRRHQTFFEMLGNFSFGDYFKEEAIEFAWEFLTKELAMDPKVLHPTIFEDDDEAAELWQKIAGFPPSKIVRLGAEDNFWSMGDTGPCGPDSEIFYDRTGKCLKDGSDCPITCDCERWWEFWNLVFMQYDRSADGTLTPLAQKGIDTGMGLDRLTSLLQGADSNYENDLFVPLIERVQQLTGDREITLERRPAYRAIADHSRAMTFLIADGVLPSNEGRGYVLRRILRRASYQGRLLGLTKPFLTTICDTVIEIMGDAYPIVRESESRIMDAVADEEERFLQTLESGLTRLEQMISGMSIPLTIPMEIKPAPSGVLRGEDAFKLYDTFGFPIDLTRKALEARGWRLDEEGFERALEEQRERGRAALGQERGQDEALLAAARGLDATRFVGYDALDAGATVVALFTSSGRASEAREGDEVQVVLDASPFYAEGGGQVGDSGHIAGANGDVAIENVRRVGHGVFVHHGRVERGRIAEGETVRAEVDPVARQNTMRNHTATHLLHKALRVVLGPQAKQAGSLVAPDRLRFDFFHNKPLTEDELHQTERIVREQVLLDRSVRIEVMPLQEALATNADAMFDEKYGEEARVVSVSNGDVFSRELCGGTHCHHTGQVGAFVIVEQRSVGAGVRRVEALTGERAYAWFDERRKVIDELSHEYNVPVAELPERLRALQERAREAPKAAAPSNLPDPQEVIARAEQRNGALVIIDRVDAADAESLRDFGDELRRRVKSAAIVLGTVFDDKPSVIVMLTPDRIEAGLHAGKLAQQIGKQMGAGGGGRPDVATAGGRDASGLDAGLALARELLAGKTN
ncbi:MAG: alanine--tRNA ligase [Dehalococcoidia bacterium]